VPSAYIAGQPAYAPYATAESTWPAQVGPPGVDVEFRRDAIARTSRLTVAFRLILAFPHLIAVVALSFAMLAVVIVAWFAALFTARVPEGLYGFMGWIVQYATRVISYTWLLTDRWPTFSETPDDPVQVRLPGRQRLNRAAVLFRLILQVPAYFLAGILSTGVAVVGFFVWLIVLIRGRMPQPVFDAVASASRYQTRYYSYLTMLTARYPGGVYGDGPVGELPRTDVVAPPQVNRSAKRMVVLLIVLGVLGLVAQTVAASLTDHTAQQQQAEDDLTTAYQSMQLSNATKCFGTTNQLSCVRDSARQNAGALRTFKEDFDNIDFPPGFGGDVNAVRQATDQFVSDFDQLSQVSSLQEYQRLATSTDISGDGRAFDDAVRELDDALAVPDL
jgi:Domain of unknown function (DUF4389)